MLAVLRLQAVCKEMIKGSEYIEKKFGTGSILSDRLREAPSAGYNSLQVVDYCPACNTHVMSTSKPH